MTDYVDDRTSASGAITHEVEKLEEVIATGIGANHSETLVTDAVSRGFVRFIRTSLGVLLALAFLSLAARAQAFVSAKTGVDVGACPVTAPCRSITYSLSQAVEGGTVNVVDSGIYAPFVVNKSVTVQAAPGVVAVITRNTAGPGISIEAEGLEHITVRGLTLNLPDNLFSPRPGDSVNRYYRDRRWNGGHRALHSQGIYHRDRCEDDRAAFHPGNERQRRNDRNQSERQLFVAESIYRAMSGIKNRINGAECRHESGGYYPVDCR